MSGPEEREADHAERMQAYYESLERTEQHEEEQVDEALMEQAARRMSFHVNEFGERIPYALTVAPVESEGVTDKILQAMQVLR